MVLALLGSGGFTYRLTIGNLRQVENDPHAVFDLMTKQVVAVGMSSQLASVTEGLKPRARDRQLQCKQPIKTQVYRELD